MGDPHHKLYDLLALTLIRYEDDFGAFVLRDPKQRYSSNNLHPLQSAMAEAYALAGVSADEQAAWKKEVKDAYVYLNYSGLPVQVIERYSNDVNPIKVDPRNIIECVTDVAKATEANTHLIIKLMDKINLLTNETASLRREMAAKNQQNALLSSANQQQINNNTVGIVSPLRTSHRQATNQFVLTNSQETIKEWAYVRQSCESSTNPVEKFCLYHTLQFVKSYNKHKLTVNTVSAKDSKFAQNMKNFHLGMIHYASRSMAQPDVPSDVPDRPTNNITDLLRWEKTVERIAEAGFAQASLEKPGNNKASYTDIRNANVRKRQAVTQQVMDR